MKWFPLLAGSVALLSTSSLFADPVISEFMASNDFTIADEDGEYADWIEIHNPDATPVDMTGWHLTDDIAAPTMWAFPAVTIPADGYLLVFATKKNRAVAGSELHTNFKLSSGGEYLALIKPDGVTKVTEFNEYPGQITDYSYGLPQQTQVTDTVVGDGATVRYHIPTGAVADWNTIAFDDSTWTSATSGLGYERSAGNDYDPYFSTDIESAIYGVQTTAYLRYEFNVADPSAVNGMNLLAKFDDGFAAYLNGELLTSANVPLSRDWNSSALSSQEANLNTFNSWDMTALKGHLATGKNVLAIQLMNHSTTSSDLLMLPKLELLSDADITPGEYSYFVQPTPGAVNNTPAGLPSGEVSLSVPSGIKSGAILVGLSTPDPLAEIRYTLDGTDPDETSALYSEPLAISDPTQLRARAYDPGKSGGKIVKGDYSFLDESLAGYIADVPVIVMDNFGAGGYPNKGRSPDGNNVQKLPWQGNVVSFYDVAGNSEPFSQAPSLESRTGCRVRGSSSSTFPRKSLSVEFWDNDDNDDDTISPLGMPAEADWALYAPYEQYDKTFLHNKVSFEFGKLIGAQAPDSRVVVVFQNKDGGKIGLQDLAGVYVLMEKVERNRIGSDFEEMSADGMSGGWMIEIDRLDSIPVGMPADTVQPNFHCAGPNGILEVPDDVDGASGSQPDDISNYYHSFLNFAEPDGYEILPAQRNEVQTRTRAMDALMWSPGFGDEVTGYQSAIDVDTWIRYYIAHNFAMNQDAIVLSTRIFQRTPSSKIEMGPLWDFDRAYTGQGSANRNPLWASNRDWYAALFGDSNFVQAHQDAWQEARRTVISDSVLRGLVDNAAAGLREDQIVASGLSYSEWQSRLTAMKDWMVARAQYLDSQYEALPSMTPETQQFVDSVSVTMAPTAGGVVYFTTDGSDPRDWGGAVSTSATQYSEALVLGSRTRVTARTLDGGRWSGKVVRDFYQLTELPELVVSEIAYHPSDPDATEQGFGLTDSDQFEYLEIMNIGATAADLTVLELADGVEFDFSSGDVTSLAAGARVLVVSDRFAFEMRYGLDPVVTGVYSGTLKNSSDRIVLRDALLGIDYQNFAYDDGEPWPTAADGDGYSLILKAPLSDPDHSVAANWRASSTPTGNPGVTDERTPFAGTSTDDDDHDGVSALVEHFLGTSDSNATEGMSRMKLGQALVQAEGEIYPTLEVRYTIGADDVTNSVEWSSDLGGWLGGDANVLLMSDSPNGDGTGTRVWRSTQPLEIAPQFFRVKVLQQP